MSFRLFEVLPTDVRMQVRDGMVKEVRSAVANLAKTNLTPEATKRLHTTLMVAGNYAPDAVRKVTENRRYRAMLAYEVRKHDRR